MALKEGGRGLLLRGQHYRVFQIVFQENKFELAHVRWMSCKSGTKCKHRQWFLCHICVGRYVGYTKRNHWICLYDWLSAIIQNLQEVLSTIINHNPHFLPVLSNHWFNYWFNHGFKYLSTNHGSAPQGSCWAPSPVERQCRPGGRGSDWMEFRGMGYVKSVLSVHSYPFSW